MYRDTSLERNFRTGVGHDAWCDAAPVKDKLGYGDNALNGAVDDHNADGNVGLIVTVGGVASARAALRRSKKPFLSLFGDVIASFPGTITGNFFGGIFLHTFLNNDERVAHLKRPPHRFTDSQICLLSNPNSVYAPEETGQWPNPPRGRILNAGTAADIVTAFADFTNDGTLRAMIISADGFFQDNKDTIIDQANQSDKHVSYPFQIFAEGHVKPRHQRHTLHGPKLATAYFNLGKKAEEVINSGRPSTLDQAATEVHDN
jgi:hypothetical protein